MLFKEAFSVGFEVQDASVDANMWHPTLPAEIAQKSDREADSGCKLRFCECVAGGFGTKHKRFLNFLLLKARTFSASISKANGCRSS
jgi:hypothetical protein